MAPHSSTVAWKIPWTEEPGGLQSMGSLRVRHDWVTSLSCTGEGNGNPLQCSCLENPRDRGAWWAAVYGVTQSRTRLKWLSSSSSSKPSNRPHPTLLPFLHDFPSLFARVSIEKHPQTQWLKQQTFYCLTILKIGSLKSKCWQLWFLLWAVKEASIPGFLP